MSVRALLTYDDSEKYVVKSIQRAYEIVKEDLMGMADEDFDNENFESPQAQREYMLWELEDTYKNEYKGQGFWVCDYCLCEPIEEIP